MGGVATDLDGRSSLPGLYAVGECSCTGLHGANRIASNSLAECFVFGRRAALAATADPESAGRAGAAAGGDALPALPPPATRAALWRLAGLRRAPEGLRELSDDPFGLARLIAAACLARAESRGAHQRSDHPERRPGPRRDPYPGGRGRRAALRALGMSTDANVTELFGEAMASLASGVAVITARRPDGEPCGLTATSVASYSAHPPSLLLAISHSSRCHDALARSERFGVHILRADELELAHEFAGKGEDKFGGLDWHWDDDVPELRGTLAYLRCRRAANFARYDHTVLIGDLEGGRLEQGEPLLYARRRMDWLLRLELE